MLKIKDNVDLKELEKFGFEYNPDTYSYFRILDKNDSVLCQCFISIITKITTINLGFLPKSFYLCTPLSATLIDEENFSDDIKDLIQAGLVEKVVE